MNIENELRNLILEKYGTLVEFCKKIDIPTSTLYSIFNRGLNNANITSVITICKELGISADAF